MEEDEYDRSREQMKDRMSHLTPEEARRKAKDVVGKSVALGAGAIEGYVENLDPRVAGEAARVAGQTLRRTADAVREEMPERTSSTGFESGDEGGRGSMKERLSESAGAMREKAAHKADELKHRSKESFAHLKEEMKTHSADEMRAKARDAVGRQIARGTGALEGIVEEADPDLPARAVHRTGEAVREAAHAVKDEVKGSKSQDPASDTTTSGGI